MDLVECARTVPSGGQMSANDRRWLLAAARYCLRACPSPYVLEIGAYKGASTALLALAAREAREDAVVISIDPFWVDSKMENQCSDYVQPYFEDWLATLRRENLLPSVVGIVSKSARAAALVPLRLNFCLIDGNHNYEAVLDDLELYAGRVDSAGLVYLHDYWLGSSDVKRAAMEYVEINSCELWTCPPGKDHGDFAILYQMPEALRGMWAWMGYAGDLDAES